MRVILVLAVVLGACTGGAASPAGSRAGTITIGWTGHLQGRFTAPATARWCAMDTLLEVIGLRGDTAVGLSLITQDSIRVQVYPVNGFKGFSPGRPQAGVGLRLLGQVNLLGFEAMSGQVRVTRTGSTVSGRFEGRLRPVSSADTLGMMGSFDEVPVVTAQGFCGRANRPGGG
jgi:hypothetical protein